MPAALGNRTHLLPQGVVCDRCNHYFGGKLEHAVLQSGYFNNLRSRQSLPSRKGNPVFGGSILRLDDVLVPAKFSQQAMSVIVDNTPLPTGETAFQKLMSGARGELIVPRGGKEPDQKAFSRFLAKMGFEAVANKVCHVVTYEEFLLHEQFDPIRNWARYGRGVSEWPFYVRHLYDEDGNFKKAKDDEGFQVLFEYDFLLTGKQEIYFVICLFGVEFTINMGGPEIEGYETWLKENEFASPLYTGKNLDTFQHSPFSE